MENGVTRKQQQATSKINTTINQTSQWLQDNSEREREREKAREREGKERRQSKKEERAQTRSREGVLLVMRHDNATQDKKKEHNNHQRGEWWGRGEDKERGKRGGAE
jgi:hypothetical protein